MSFFAHRKLHSHSLNMTPVLYWKLIVWWKPWNPICSPPPKLEFWLLFFWNPLLKWVFSFTIILYHDWFLFREIACKGLDIQNWVKLCNNKKVICGYPVFFGLHSSVLNTSSNTVCKKSSHGFCYSRLCQTLNICLLSHPSFITELLVWTTSTDDYLLL